KSRHRAVTTGAYLKDEETLMEHSKMGHEAEIPPKGTGNHFPNRLHLIRKRVTDGFPCTRHSHPWIAALFHNYEQHCSGVLVHPQWVLSAAHCWKPSYTVGLGLHGLHDWYEPGSQMIKASLSVIHPEYDKSKHANDIMLVKLNTRVVESDTIRIIPIASQCPTAGTRCLLAGWGQLLNGYFPLDLHCAVIPLLSDNYCRLVLDTLYHESIFCAAGEGRKDACQFDSGGPLICNGLLQGLVSWGSNPCGIPGFPGFYTNLCKFKEWIREVIRTR
ncbi:PREDICTED: kallikrein-4-like, partial [Chinchilla lanigera]|uniref:kallikrein-4-like n=1 Tax=Chinchilla lanigera TaxID=34839 RepID=UPI000698A0E3